MKTSILGSRKRTFSVWLPAACRPLQSLGLYWRVGEVHDWENAPELLIQVPEQEASRPPTGNSPRPDGPSLLVLSPPWGYGELLASLVADGLGYGNIDFRYFGLPDHGPARTERVQAELDTLPAGFAITVPPLMLLDGLRLRANHLRRALPVLITYGERVRHRASQVYGTTLAPLAGNPRTGIAQVEARYIAALHQLPASTEYLHVTLADDDVTSATTVDRDRLNDTIAWLALTVTSMILDRWQSPPQPRSGTPARTDPALRPATHTTSHGKPSRVANGRTGAQRQVTRTTTSVYLIVHSSPSPVEADRLDRKGLTSLIGRHTQDLPSAVR